MFERLRARAAAHAERRRDAKAHALAALIGQALPNGIEAARVSDGVQLSGYALRRRFTLDPALRWLLERLR